MLDVLQLETRNGETALELARGVHPATRAQRKTRDAIVDLLERAEASELSATNVADLKMEHKLDSDNPLNDLGFEEIIE